MGSAEIQTNSFAENEYTGEKPPSNPEGVFRWIVNRQREITGHKIFIEHDCRPVSFSSMKDAIDGYKSYLEDIGSDSVSIEVNIPPKILQEIPGEYNHSHFLDEGFTKPDDFSANGENEKAQMKVLKAGYMLTKLYNGTLPNRESRSSSTNIIILSFKPDSDETKAILFDTKYNEEYRKQIEIVEDNLNRLQNGFVDRVRNHFTIESEKIKLTMLRVKFKSLESKSNEFKQKYPGFNIVNQSTIQTEINSLGFLSNGLKGMLNLLTDKNEETRTRENINQRDTEQHDMNDPINSLTVSPDNRQIIGDFRDYIGKYKILIDLNPLHNLEKIKNECKKAYRRFAFRYHPDRSSPNERANNQEIFKGVGDYYDAIIKMRE